MRAKLLNRRRGQVLVMVTLALLAMCGMMGLVVDLGWSYYITKSAQAAADAGAIAAVRAAQDQAGAGDPAQAYQCGGGDGYIACGTYDCPGAPDNLARACWYAQQHGFATAGRQHVTVTAADRFTAPTVTENCGQGGAEVRHPPTTGCVDVFYWATVRVAEEIPQLFSSIFGNTTGMASGRATACVGRVEAIGSLYLVGRENDPWNPTTGGPATDGTNLDMGGSGELNVPGGILMASASDEAGFISGSGDVTSPFTYFREGGDYDIQGSGTWTTAPEPAPDGQMFLDPYGGLGQPPLIKNTVLTMHAVLNGALTCNPCLPGNYYAVNGGGQATGEQLTITSDTSFDGGAFGEFNFFGGVRIMIRFFNEPIAARPDANCDTATVKGALDRSSTYTF